MEYRFEWDQNKNNVNQRKHGISFEEAIMVFSDPRRYEEYDRVHSLIEKRWIVIGLAGCKLIKISFTERKSRIRVISARKADKKDMEVYFYGYSTQSS